MAYAKVSLDSERLGYLLLFLVAQTLSLCVLEDGTNSTCTNSSLLLVSRTQLKEDNGYSLIVNELPNITTNCTTTNKEIYAVMGGSHLLVKPNNDVTSVKVW